MSVAFLPTTGIFGIRTSCATVRKQTSHHFFSTSTGSFVAVRRHARFRANTAASYIQPVTNIRITSETTAPAAVPSSSILSIASNIIGSLVLIGSLVYKLPQVIRIMRRRSARGVSMTYYLLETVATMFSAIYFARRAYPFVTYGEAVFGLVINVAILYLIFHFEKYPKIVSIAYSIVFFGLLFFLASKAAPMQLLASLQLLSIPMLNFAKVPQIWLNWQTSSTGELAPITLGLQLLGNVARIFTTIAQVRDGLMLTSSVAACIFNAVLFGQWLIYNNGSRGAVSAAKS